MQKKSWNYNGYAQLGYWQLWFDEKYHDFFVGKNREMVDKESMAGDGLWQNCNNTDGWVQDYREDEGSTLYLLRRSNEIRFLWMLHDRFDRWGLGIASSSSAANRENPGRRWRSPPLIPRNTKDYLPYNTQSKIPRIFVFEWRSKILLTQCIEFETRREDGIAFEKLKMVFQVTSDLWSLPKSLLLPSPYKLNSSTAEKPLKCKDLPASAPSSFFSDLHYYCDLICQNNETCRVIKFRQVFLPKGIQSSEAGE